MQVRVPFVMLVLGIALVAIGAPISGSRAAAQAPAFNISTLAGRMASIDATPGLFIRGSAFLQQEGDLNDTFVGPAPAAPITPTFVLSSPLDGSTIVPPPAAVNQDTHGASQNEPAVAIDPNHPDRIVVGMNDYAARAWSCTVGSTPCSALADGYSGTYYSNDGGATWCCVSTDPGHLGTLIPGVEHLTGGIYDAGGDPSLAFNSKGDVFYAGLGFDRVLAPDTVTVSKGTFDASGALTWGAPTFINPVASPSILNDKEWIAVDAHAGSAFQDRIYVSWTRFVFNPLNGRYAQSPIAFAYSKDDGATFSEPALIGGNVLYDQGSRPVVGPDGTVYVFWEGSTHLATFDSIWMVKSIDGGLSWSAPVALSTVTDIRPPLNTVFRVNSFPAVAAGPDGALYATWNTEVNNTMASAVYSADPTCAYFVAGARKTDLYCHSSVVWSKSTDGGATWSSPVPAFPSLEAASRTPDGYPATSSWGNPLNAPASRPADSVYPAIAVAPNGDAYLSAYAADVVSPWLLCDHPATPTAVGRIDCLGLGNYTHNARLDYVITNLATGDMRTLTTHPINTRYHFGGGFIGDYTELAVDANNVFHAVWMDSNRKQSTTWWYGYEFVPTSVNQQDIVIASGTF